MSLPTPEEIMIPLSEYAVVDADATMIEALRVLDEAQANLPSGSQPHRAMLVKGGDGRIVGKLGHHAFLAGLEPGYAEIFDQAVVARTGLSASFLQTVTEPMSLWKLDFDSYVRRAMTIKVADVMHPVTEQVEVDAPIGEALHKLISYNALSLIVTKNEEPVGVLRLGDLFSMLAQLLRQRAEQLEQP